MIASSELRQSPLRAEHERSGAKFVEFGGWEMPLSYPSGTIAEHLACRNDAVCFDVSHLGTVRVEGPGAFDALQESFTNDLRKIGPGRAQYTHLLAPDASVLDDIIIWWVEENRFDVMPNASNTTRVRAAIGGTDVTSERAVIAIQGPRARERLSGVAPEAAAVAHFGVGRFTFEGAECLVAGTGYTGEDGVECAVPAAMAPQFWRAVLSTGIVPAGLGARDTVRLEAGLPLHGHELGPGITPLQAGINFVVSFDKGPFTGREALLEEREKGPARKMRAVLSSTRRPLHGGDAVISEGVRIGELTSGNFSPVLGRGIGLALVEPTFGPGAPVEVLVRGEPVAARLVKGPFHHLELPLDDGGEGPGGPLRTTPSRPGEG